MRTIHRRSEQIFAELQAVLHGVEDRLSPDDYAALATYIFHHDELPVDELISKIESSLHPGPIREGLMTTAEQLIKKGFEKGEELGLQEGRRELVRSMNERGMTVADIAHATGLTAESIRALLSQPGS
jgi:hypothetical protein